MFIKIILGIPFGTSVQCFIYYSSGNRVCNVILMKPGSSKLPGV